MISRHEASFHGAENETSPALSGRAEGFLADGRLHNVLLAIPAYNEERFIGSVVLWARLVGLSVLVIDDGSTDGTAEIAAAAGAMVETHSVNRGKAEALNTAFRSARSCNAEALVVLDGDGQHNVAEIEPFLEAVYKGEADIVIGSRFLSTSAGNIARFRQLGQRAMTTLTNVGSGTPITDSQSGFRAFSRRAIEVMWFSSRGFGGEGEMQFLAREHALRMIEVPITARYPDPPKRHVVSHGLQVLNVLLGLIGRHRPLLFFGLTGVVLILLGLTLGYHTTRIYQSTGVLAVGYGLITVLLIITGMLSVFTSVVLHSIRGSFLDLHRRFAILTASSSAPTPGAR